MTEVDIEDPGQLVSLLRDNAVLPETMTATCLTLHGGVSNRTVRVDLSDGRHWVVKQALAKLRVKDDWFCDTSRIRREAEGIRWLQRLAPPGSVPALVFELPDHGVFGMEWVPEPHTNLKQLLLSESVTEDEIATHFASLGRFLGCVQSNAATHQAELARAFADRRFYESLRIEPYYVASAERVPGARAFLEALIDRSRAGCTTLVHGDFSPKNVLVTRDGLVLLDHEVIHFGDRGFDVGFMLAHALSKAHHVRPRRAAFLAGAMRFWDRYRQSAGTVDESLSVAHALGCLLARAVGKSPMDYLSPDARVRQRDVVVSMMMRPPHSIPQLIRDFGARLDAAER